MTVSITPSNPALRTPHGTLGNAIRKLREERQWTQLQLAKKLNRTQGAIAAYENGRICPSVMTAQRMAIVFNVPLEFLLSHRRTLFTNPKHGP